MILILGGGLAGLSTAFHLGRVEHLVLEAEDAPGGLCRSRTVSGFTFDYTGHLLHLRDERIVRLVEALLPDAFAVVQRRAAIRTRGATLAFPFQAHLNGLPREVVAECLVDFARSLTVPVPDDPTVDFETWSMAVFGRGISSAFLLPYNRKLFCREPAEMTADWVSWAVPKPTLEQVVRGALGIPNEGMGYNATFRYPKRGGIGILADALARRVEHVRTGARVERIDLDRRQVELASGERLAFDRLVSTLPLPDLLRRLDGAGSTELAAEADALDWSVVACWNVGVDQGSLAEGAHWIYFPDADAPFYRVGFPTNFSTAVAPEGMGSMYVEFGLKRDEPLDRLRLEREAQRALVREGILSPGTRVLASDWVRIDPGYVIFDRKRQRVIERVLPALEGLGIHPIGRYGAWTYSYMERALLDGLETATRIVRAET